MLYLAQLFHKLVVQLIESKAKRNRNQNVKRDSNIPCRLHDRAAQFKVIVYHLNQEDMDQIVTHLSNAKKRLIVGARSSYSAALWMGTLLNQLLGNTKVVHEFYDSNFEYLTEASENTVVLLISFARYTKWSLKYAQIAKNHGAKILAITDSISSPAWALADHAIITEINLNEMGFNSFSCLYCLFDSIVAKIRKTRCKSISTRLHDLEELYSDFDLFYE